MALPLLKTIGHRRRDSAPTTRVTLLGVDFTWKNPGEGHQDALDAGLRSVCETILEASRDAMRRQKRTVVAYWDAMTCLAAGGLVPASLRETAEAQVVVDLVAAFGAASIEPRHSTALGELRSIAAVRSRLTYEYGATADPETKPAGQIGADRLDYDLDGQWRFRPSGPCRILELDMGDLAGRAGDIDWPATALLAILAQLRADVEIFLETGLLRSHRCEREACGAFFRVSRMAGRPRFCSGSCRASAAREQPRRSSGG